MFCISGIIRENSLTFYIFIYNYNNDFYERFGRLHCREIKRI